MSSIFDDPYGYSIGLIKPVEFPNMDLPNTQKIFQHAGENTTAYKWVTTRINNLMKMSKFMPDYMSKLFGVGADGVTQEDLTQFGQAYLTPQEGVINATNGSGNPWDSHHGYNDEIFGFTHNLVDAQGNQWGAGSGIYGKENLNYDPSAWDQVLVKDRSSDPSFNDTWMDDPNLFRQAIDYNSSGQLINGAPNETFGDYRNYIGSAQDLLASFGGKSYYEIVMSGMKGTTIRYVDDPNSSNSKDQMIDYAGTQFGSFDYDNLTPYQDFLLATSMVRDRRAIFATMSEIFGSFRNIYNGGSAIGPDDQAMINTMSSWMNDPTKGKGVDPSTLSWFDEAFKAQHYLHTILPAFSGGADWSLKTEVSNSSPALGDGDGGIGENGATRDAQDQVAFKRFREKIRKGAQAYIDSLPSKDNKETKDVDEKAVHDNAQSIFNEFIFSGYDLPYGSFDAANPKIGWDFYSIPGITAPNANQNAQWPHPFYAISQSETGPKQNNSDINQKNWVLNELGRLTSFKTASAAKVSNTIFMNMLNSRIYRNQTITYKNKKEEIADQVAETRRDEAKANAKAAARNAALRKQKAVKNQSSEAFFKNIANQKTISKALAEGRANKNKAFNTLLQKPDSSKKKK